MIETNGPLAFSADAAYAAISTYASDVVTGDTNGTSDVFLLDLARGTRTRVSVGMSGSDANNYSEAPSISADGRFVAFESNACNLVAGDTNANSDVDRARSTHRRDDACQCHGDGPRGGGHSCVELQPNAQVDGQCRLRHQPYGPSHGKQP